MRIFTQTKELISEVKRDLVEMWQNVSTYSMQNKIIEGMEDYETKEITNYSFSLSDLDNIEDLLNYPEFIDAEKKKIEEYFKENDRSEYFSWLRENYSTVFPIEEYESRILTVLKLRLKEDWKERKEKNKNPGTAWKIRPWVWSDLTSKKDSNQFDYTYSERIHIDDLIKEIKKHPFSRQYVYNIWDREDRFGVNWQKRIPCSLFYQVLIRNNGEVDDDLQPIYELNLVYTMRSCDFLTHFPIDIAQAINFMKEIHSQLKDFSYGTLKLWKLFYNCTSLHLFKKDLIHHVF